MHKLDYERIEQILWDSFEAARKERDQAMESINEVIGEIPSGPLHPDGAQRIKNSSREYTEARQKLLIAMERLNAFRNRGIVPDDLERKPQGREGGKEVPRSGSGGA